jgi:tRNA (cmo5U34)-methyltransferase
MPEEVVMERRDHHDWTSEAYVAEWVERQQSRDPARAERLQLLCDLLPLPEDARGTILDVGAGYGPVSKYILDRFPNATCIAQDGSAPMLQCARQLMAGYAARFTPHQSDLFDQSWLPQQYGPFDAAVSALCLHNLRDFGRISEIYRDIRAHLKPGGVFLNLDLLNAPTPELQQRYLSVAAARRQRQGAAGSEADTLLQRAPQPATQASTYSFPANLEQHLAALRAAGFSNTDCFWKDLQQALYGGYA